MFDLISENYSLLLFLEHLDIDFAVGNKTVSQICREYNINLQVFLVLANMYNGFYPSREEVEKLEDIALVIRFLKNSHLYYKNDKYPELRQYIRQHYENHKTNDILLIEKFFNDYFEEVLEHLNYEEEVAFPYFCSISGEKHGLKQTKFSGREYRDHHSDIETKLEDLKSLLLKHITLEKHLPARRKFLYSLFELENDLRIHSLVEELVLMPMVARLENTDLT